MDSKPKLKKYYNPIDAITGKRYFVPCVAKNKDALVYYLIGINNCAESILKQMPPQSSLKTDLRLYSLRFNDILPDGKKVHELTKQDFDEMAKQSKEINEDKHPDNNVKSQDNLLSISCPNCGNPYIFNNPDEIPEETFFCGMCERVLIDYTGIDDWKFEFYEA